MKVLNPAFSDSSSGHIGKPVCGRKTSWRGVLCVHAGITRWHLIMKNKLEVSVLVVYTLINLKLMWPFLFGDVGPYAFLANGGFTGATIILLSLFLNAALIIYWLRLPPVKIL